MNVKQWIATALGLGIAGTIAAVSFLSPMAVTTGVSSVTGLATLRSLARESMAYREAIADNCPTVIEFYADWCTTCQGMAPALQRLHRRYEQIDFAMANIDDPRAAEAMRIYQVKGVPHLVFLDSDRSVVEEFIGSVPLPILERTFARLSVVR